MHTQLMSLPLSLGIKLPLCERVFLGTSHVATKLKHSAPNLTGTADMV